MPEPEIITLIQFSKEFADHRNLKIIRNSIFKYRPFSFWQSTLANRNLILAWFWNLLHSVRINGKFLICSRKLKAFYDADIIIHLGTNLYGEDFGIRGFIEHSKEIQLARLLKKPIVMYAESLGPFNSSFTRSIAKYLLNRVNLITLRDDVSREYLEEVGVTVPPIYLTADPAFLLEPSPEKRIVEILKSENVTVGKRPVVGVILSAATNLKEKSKKSRVVVMITFVYSLARYFLPESIIKAVLGIIKCTGYFDTFQSRYVTNSEDSKLFDHITEKLGVDILIIPHIHQEGIFADSDTAMKTQGTAKHQGRINAIEKLYLSEELKGIIGKCDMLISSRMHAAIAAMAQCIPTVLIPVSQRHHGIMRMTGQEKYVCKNFTREEVMPKVEEAWAKREKIKLEIEAKMKDIKKASLQNAELVRDLLNKK